MNIIESLTDRIESYRKDNKNPCKNYSTEANAIKATKIIAKKAAQEFGLEDANYVVFYIKIWGRWVGAIDLTSIVNHPKSHGGYLGICTGFYTY